MLCGGATRLWRPVTAPRASTLHTPPPFADPPIRRSCLTSGSCSCSWGAASASPGRLPPSGCRASAVPARWRPRSTAAHWRSRSMPYTPPGSSWRSPPGGSGDAPPRRRQAGPRLRQGLLRPSPGRCWCGTALAAPRAPRQRRWLRNWPCRRWQVPLGQSCSWSCWCCRTALQPCAGLWRGSDITTRCAVPAPRPASA